MSDDIHQTPARLSPDMPWNLPGSWAIPTFTPGEMPELVKAIGVHRIGSEIAWLKVGLRTEPLIDNVKAGIACWRLGHLFEIHRDEFAAVIRAARSGG